MTPKENSRPPTMCDTTVLAASARLDDEDDIDFADDDDDLPEAEPADAPQNEIAMVLGPLLRRPGGLRDGAIYVLNLRSFRDYFANRWPRYASRVHEIADRIITEEISPQDIHTRIGTDRYLIAYSRESQAKAAIKSDLIAKRIKEKLFGERTALNVDVQVLGSNTNPPTALDGADAGRIRPNSSALRVSAPSGELLDLSGFAGAEDVPDFVFVPIWDAYHKVLSSYACVPVQVLRSGRTRFGHELLPPDANEMDRAEFDLKILSYVEEVADDLHRNQFAVLVNFSISYDALASKRSRELLVNAFRKLPKHLGSVISVKINGAPPRIPTTTLAERVALVRPYVRGVTLELKTLEYDLGTYAYTGLHALIFGLWDWEPSRPLDIDLMAHAIRQAKAARIQFGIGGVPDTHLADKLVQAGATYLSGPFLGTALDMPANMRRLTLDELGRTSASAPPSEKNGQA